MLKTVGLQVALVLVAAACGGLYWGALGARDILLGGFACVLPNLLFARLLAQAGRRSPGTFVAAFLVGEFIKLALTVATLLAIVIWVKPACWAALLVGIVAVAAGVFPATTHSDRHWARRFPAHRFRFPNKPVIPYQDGDRRHPRPRECG